MSMSRIQPLIRPNSSLRFFATAGKGGKGGEGKVSDLSNGIKVASQTLQKGEVASLSLLLGVGSRHESSDLNGASSLISSAISKAIEGEISKLGGNVVVSNGRESTSFQINVLKNNLSKAVDILSSAFSSFTPSSLDAEKAAALKKMETAPVQSLMMDHLHGTAFQGGSLSQTILGSSSSVKGITSDSLKSFFDKSFLSSRVVVSAAGAVNHDDLVKAVEKGFGKFSLGAAPNSKTPYFTGSEVKIRDDDEHDTHIAFAVQGASWTSEDSIPLMIAQHVMGSWDKGLGGGKNLSSKLAQSIAQHGLCTSYSAFNLCYSDTGLFGFYAIGNNRTRLDDLMFQFQNDWVRICVNATEAEVESAKARAKFSLSSSMDDSSSLSQENGTQLLLSGQPLTLEELHYQIGKVDAKTLRNVAYKYLYDKDPAIVAFGPVEGFPDYNRISTATSWLRV